jgi:hypothetical protein
MTAGERDALISILSRHAGAAERRAFAGPRSERVHHLAMAEVLGFLAVNLAGMIERLADDRRRAVDDAPGASSIS